MRRTYSTRQRIITTTSLQHRRTNGGAARLAVVPLKKRKTRIRRKVKLAPDLQHAGACLYNNFLATPAHNGGAIKFAVVPLKKRKTRKRRKIKLAPDCRGALARCVAMERQRNPEKPIAKTGCAQV